MLIYRLILLKDIYIKVWMSKGIVFIVTLLASMSRVGLIGSYAAVKYSISKDFHVGEGFLGNSINI